MGVKEKKAIRNISEFIETEGQPMMTAAAKHPSLKVELDVQEDLEAKEINIGASNVKDFIKAFAMVCEDEDYREEIASLEKVVMCVQREVERNTSFYLHGMIELKEKAMVIRMDCSHSLANGGIGDLAKFIQSLY